MRKLGVVIAMAALMAMATLAGAGDNAWFDMENCGMCSNLVEHPELMEHIKWEHYAIGNGIISVTTVEEDYVKEYRAVNMKMAEAGQRMMQGEKVEMCGSCSHLAGTMMKGAKPEFVETSAGAVMIVTSDDAAVVAELHKWAKKNMTELEKMRAMDHPASKG